MIKRRIADLVAKRIDDKKAIVIMGARQVGKTTLLESLFEDENGNI